MTTVVERLSARCVNRQAMKLEGEHLPQQWRGNSRHVCLWASPVDGSADRFTVGTGRPACYHVEVFVLFAITMVCFFALFGMIVALLRQAKAEGAMESAQALDRTARVRERGEFPSPAPDASEYESMSSAPEGDLRLSLSTLVPRKQPDWRFMVRERRSRLETRTRTPQARRSANSGYGTTRPDWAHFNADLGDLNDPEAPIIRRA